MNKPIGIYDSGVGGLTVLKALRERFTHETFVYFGDTLNLPYGNKSKAEIIEYSRHIVAWFQNKIDAKLVIAACHTSSALALDEIIGEFRIPIIGTIYPLLNCILNNNQYRSVGIIATPASVKSRVHEKILIENGFKGEVVSIACPEFVPLIESNQTSELIMRYAREYLSVFEQRKLDTLIYGCTHYPFIKSIIEAALPIGTKTIDPAQYIASEAYDFLQSQSLLNTNTLLQNVEFYCSHQPDIFAEKVSRHLAKQLNTPLTIQPQATIINVRDHYLGE